MPCKIEIVQGRDLVPMDLNGKSDPYVKIFFGGHNIQVKKTTTRKATLKPMWNETFFFQGSETGMDTVRLELWDEDSMKSHDYMGEVEFAVCSKALSTPSGNVADGPVHEGDAWLKIQWRDKDGLRDGNFGSLQVRWLYSHNTNLFAAHDVGKPIDIVDSHAHVVEKLPSLDVAIIQANCDKIEMHIAGAKAPFQHIHSVLMWENPLVTVCAFWLALWCAWHQVLLCLIPFTLLSIMLKNLWLFCRYGPEGRDTEFTEEGAVRSVPPPRAAIDLSALGITDGVGPIEQTRQLVKLARRFQKFTAGIAARLDYVSECVKWIRRREAIAITTALLAGTFLPVLVFFFYSFTPPSYVYTIPIVTYHFTIYPLYENFPVIKRLYGPSSLVRIVSERLSSVPMKIMTLYYCILRRAFKFNPIYAFKIQQFVCNARLRSIQLETARKHKISHNDKRRHLFVTILAVRRVDRSLNMPGLFVRCTVNVPGVEGYKEERKTTPAKACPPIWNERVCFLGVPPRISAINDHCEEIVVELMLGKKTIATDVIALSNFVEMQDRKVWLDLKGVKDKVSKAELCVEVCPWNMGCEDPSVAELRQAEAALNRRKVVMAAAAAQPQSKLSGEDDAEATARLLNEIAAVSDELKRLEADQSRDEVLLQQAMKSLNDNILSSPQRGLSTNRLAGSRGEIGEEPADDEAANVDIGGYYCDGCRWARIEGPVWECQVCDDFTLCEMCYRYCDRVNHNENHTFLQIQDEHTTKTSKK
eukprot:PhM_4_TR13520/c0_g1_i1/m.30777